MRRLFYSFATAVLLTGLLPVVHASAFTTGSASAAPDSSSGFVDPEEQVHSFFFGSSGVNEDGWVDRNPVSRNLSPTPDATNQGGTFPNLLSPTTPRR
jgi:hypothetical protein